MQTLHHIFFERKISRIDEKNNICFLKSELFLTIMYRKLVDLWNNELVKQCWERIPNSEIFSSELCTKIQYFAHSAIFHYNTSRTGTSRTFDFPLLYKIVGFFVTHRHGLRQIDTLLNSFVSEFQQRNFKKCLLLEDIHKRLCILSSSI